MDYESFKQKYEKFDLEHGGIASTIVSDNWLLFPDGASREVDPRGIWCSPPNDPYECAKLVVYYWELKLELAIEEFKIFRHQLLSRTKIALQAPYSPPSPEKEHLLKLAEMAKKVKTCQNELKKAKKAMKANKPERLKERERISELNRQENSDFLNEIEKLQV
jgi:hypothetical protein